MLDTQTKQVYKNKGFKSIYLSGFFFFIIVSLSIGLYFYNNSLLEENLKVKTKISQLEDSIEEKQKNELIQVYDLFNKNKIAIKRLESQSKITDFINHIEESAVKYDVNLEGFNYSNGVLSLNATTFSDSEDEEKVKLDYQKTVDFIKLYRKNENNPFDLGFINNFKNIEDKQLFNITFSLKEDGNSN